MAWTLELMISFIDNRGAIIHTARTEVHEEVLEFKVRSTVESLERLCAGRVARVVVDIAIPELR